MSSELHEEPDSEKRASEATAWFLGLKEPTATDADHLAFRRWLSQHPDNRQAYNDVARLWSDLGTPATILAESGWHRTASPPRRAAAARALRYGAPIAACLVLVTSVAIWRDASLLDRLRADYSTPPGDRREVVLADGSRALLDGGAALTVRFENNERRVRLLHGRAWFDVVHDPSTPFFVTAEGAEARVLGTAFSVDQDESETGVTVERGLVQVTDPAGDAVKLPAGEQVRSAGGRLGRSRQVDPDVALAWRRGLIVLDQAPLGRVVDELERMKPGRVMIADRKLRELTLSGVFRADDPEAVLEALRSALGLKTLSIPGVATLVYR